MANEPEQIGKRITLIDPNNFENRYNGGVFSDSRDNISVPLEDLSISVELVTKTKPRTILTTEGTSNTITSVDNNIIKLVNFIDGTNDKSTGFANNLTTKYTELSTELTNIEETLGITNIEIDFNASYAPMVNIDFIDVRGGSIFQNDGTSKYNVFFRLPYPLFQLTVKGYYGKPVTYCLHLIKFNTKFNSKTGNFEISTHFVGYTYAMFADMLIGYIKAAGITKAGAEYLETKGVLSINDFIEKVGGIKPLAENELLNNNDPDVVNLTMVDGLKDQLNSMVNLIKTNVQFNFGTSLTNYGFAGISIPISNTSGYPKQEITSQIIGGIDIKETIILLHNNPVEDSLTYDDKDNKGVLETFNKSFTKLVTSFNDTVKNVPELAIPVTDLDVKQLVTKKSEIRDNIPSAYDIDVANQTEIENVFQRLTRASADLKDVSVVKFYDFTNLMRLLVETEKTLNIKQTDFSVVVALKLRDKVSTALGFETTIRSITNMFTTHIEAFLQQLFDVSAKAFNDPDKARFKQLERWTKNLDIPQTKVSGKDTLIYPWPEYNENGIEKYLGSHVTIPSDVPEVVFVEELYEAMKTIIKSEANLNALINSSLAWNAFSPLDSWYYRKDKNHYQRLDGNPLKEDLARLITLRAMGFLGFSNTLLTTDEITDFATSEVDLILKQFPIDDKAKLIKTLKETYLKPIDYAGVSGKVNGVDTKVIIKTEDDHELKIPTWGNNPTIASGWKYNYVYETNKRKILPVTAPFNNVTGVINTTDELGGGSMLTNFNGTTTAINDTAEYIKFIDDYASPVFTSPNSNHSVFSLDKLIAMPALNGGTLLSWPNDLGPTQMKEAGFIANAGKYGVQEFISIIHDNSNNKAHKISGEKHFFTLFFNDGDLLNTQNGGVSLLGINININVLDKNQGLLSPSLCSNRTETSFSDYDMYTNMMLPTTDSLSLPSRSSFGEFYDHYSFGKLSKIYRTREKIGQNIFNLTEQKASVSYPFVTFGALTEVNDKQVNVEMSLFGSRFYNAQLPTGHVRPLLFLHSLPWRGLISELTGDRQGLFNPNEILSIFSFRTGFVQIPELYPAFIGGLLWRYSYGTADPIRWFDNSSNLLIPTNGNDNNIPTTAQYLRMRPGSSVPDQSSSMCFDTRNESTFNPLGSDGYLSLEKTLLELPDSVKKSFIKEFEDFVIKYQGFRKELELVAIGSDTISDFDWPTQGLATWDAAWSNANSFVIGTTVPTSGVKQYIIPDTESFLITTFNDASDLVDSFNVLTFIPLEDDAGKNFENNFFLEYKDSSTAVKRLKELIFGYKYMVNNSWMIWNTNKKEFNKDVVAVSTEDFDLYMNTIIGKIVDAVKVDEESKKFNSKDEDEVKLEIYRTLKKIYDKWIAASSSPENVLFQCGDGSRMYTDSNRKARRKELNSKVDNSKEPALIDSFRFVTRSFKDIGDEFQINPLVITQMLLQNTNISFYDLISRVLTDNNFDFIALPSFIDYNKQDELKSIFTPYPYYETSDEAPTGPSFVCVYVGQTSTKLDFGDSSEHKNDGFDFTNGCLNCPDDVKGSELSNGGTRDDWEDMGAAFVVRYGQQNQNIFKDVTLDQAEFSETAESLQITDQIANSLSQTNKSYIGQNLYNVYSARSYRVDVEMLGDAMIQPMMYFQLDNIPMFHGAYLITRVKHSITPNNMSTLFSGVRIKRIETPLIDAAAIYSSILNGYKLPPATAGSVLSKSLGTSTLVFGSAKENQKAVKNYFKSMNLSKEITAGIMGNIQIESSYRLSAVNARDTNNIISIGLIQWNNNKRVTQLYADNLFSTVEQQLNFLTNEMPSWKTFIKAANDTPNLDEQYAAFLFAHYVEVCCGCASTNSKLQGSFTTLSEIYSGPYINGWKCPQDDPKAKKYFPFNRSATASTFLKRFNDSRDDLYWG
jgi:hypothetical protein